MVGYIDKQTLQDIADAIREKNGSDETYKPSEMAEAILNISGIPSLQDKSVTITKNGTHTIVADEWHEGLNSVEVNSKVYEGFDFSSICDTEQAQDFNSFYLERYISKIVYAKEIKDYIENNNRQQWNSLCLETFPNPEIFPQPNIKPTNLNRTWANCTNIIKFPYIDVSLVDDFSYAWQRVSCKYFPKLDFSNGTNFSYAWFECRSLIEVPFDELPKASNCAYMFQDCNNLASEYFNMKPTNMEGCFVRCSKLPNIYTDCSNNKYFSNTFYGCTSVSKLHIKSIAKSTGFGGTFYNLTSLTELLAEEWKLGSIRLAESSKLLPSSIHYIIQNAMSVADGATARTLTLHATAKANWEASEYYQEDLAVLEEKGITIA